MRSGTELFGEFGFVLDGLASPFASYATSNTNALCKMSGTHSNAIRMLFELDCHKCSKSQSSGVCKIYSR